MSDDPNNGSISARRSKATIKDRLQSFFKPGVSMQIQIRNMVLTDIPTQATRIFIRIKIGRNKQVTQLVKITENIAKWPDELTLETRIPYKQHTRRPFALRFSFRLEAVSGRSFTRYGNCQLELGSIPTLNDWEYQSHVHDCNYKSNFSCLITIKLKNSTDENAMTNQRFLTSSLSLDSIPQTHHFRRYGHKKKKLSKNHNTSNNRFLLLDQVKFHENNRQPIDIQDELPIKVKQEKLDILTKQVDDMISQVLYDHEN